MGASARVCDWQSCGFEQQKGWVCLRRECIMTLHGLVHAGCACPLHGMRTCGRRAGVQAQQD